MLCGVRGAVTVLDNTPEAIGQAVVQLMEALLSKNGIEPSRLVGVFFTVTPDLTALNPARACRQHLANWERVPMLCAQEPMMDETLPRCLRVLIQWTCEEASGEPVAVYLGDARLLRPDIA